MYRGGSPFRLAAVSSRRRTAGLLVAASALPLLTVVLRSMRDTVDLSSVLLLYLLLTVIAATVGGVWPGLAAAVTGFLLADYFFTEPVFTLKIDDPQIVLELVVFVLVAVVVSALVDLAARRAAEARALADGNRLRTALLAAVSHDLRTPLASIKASATSLLQTDVDWAPDTTREFVEAIVADADRLNGLVGNLLDMSRLQTGAVAPTSRAVGLDEVVPAALTDLAHPGRQVDIDVAETLPRVMADPALLERVIANLVDNALAASPPDQPVWVKAHAVDGQVDLRIVDRGPGIPRHHRDRIFQPFQRLGDTTNGNGVGLGLAVARGFTEAMHGQLTVEDTPSGGTTMVVTLQAVSA